MKKVYLNPSLGQHLTINKRVLFDIIEAVNVNKDDVVIEVGIGTGFLTQLLCQKAKKVIGYEIDKQFEPFLIPLLKKYPNLDLRFENIRRAKIDFPYDKVVGAIPYHIAEPLLWKFRLEPVESMVFVVGKKFAYIVSQDFTKQAVDSEIPLIFQSRFKIELLKIYLKSYFNPPPPIDSALIRLTSIDKESLKNDFIRYIVRYLFDHKNSKLKNALREGFIDFSRVSKNKFLSKKQADEMVRKITLSHEKSESIVDGAGIYKLIYPLSKIGI